MPLTSRRLAFHELMSRLGVGDLHPGGRATSQLFLEELAKGGAKRVLEVGAGIGLTTERMRKAGYDVTPIEPNAVMRSILSSRLSLRVHETPFEDFEAPAGSYDAVVGEGVFYGLDPKRSAAKVHRLLRSGGLLAFVDTLWTPAARPDVVAFIHDQTKEVFGIPMAPRDVSTSLRWEEALRDAGFAEVLTKTIDTAADPSRLSRRVRIARGLVAHPQLIALFLEYRAYRRIRWSPPGWLESAAMVWRRSR